jgi:hypothetical protein
MSLVGTIGASLACKPKSAPERVHATYDATSGKLSQLTVNGASDGKPNIVSYMDGTKFIRIEIDSNEDSKIDRWEYYTPDQQITRVGISRADDGKEDAWVFRGTDGSIARVQISTRRDGLANRTEFYEKGALVRAEEDTDTDGRVDKWEEYESGALTRVSFDTARSGSPTATIDYPK